MRLRRHPSQWLTLLNAHLLLVGLLLLFDLVLATKLAVAWHDSRSDQTEQYNADLRTYAQLQAQARSVQALPAQLAGSRTEADAFFAARIPASESAVLTELGAVTARDHVRLSRASYPIASAIPGLVELRIDANVTGEYTPVMHFINDLERDRNHIFFTIRSVTLTGQQGGVVNLRIRMTTYLRADAASAAALAAGSHGAENAGETE